MSKIPEEVKELFSGLPSAARTLVPDDYVINMLCRQAEAELAKDNVSDYVAIMSLLCRRIAVMFDKMAAEQEELLREVPSELK